MRRDDCKVLLEDCQNLIVITKSTVMSNLHMNDKHEIFIPATKSFFEHCRSVLEYIAQDVFEKIIEDSNGSGKSKNIYFPYGKDPSKFQDAVNKNLPNLNRYRPDIYELIEGLQDFKMGSNKFLQDMVELTNKYKHKGVVKPQRKNKRVVGIGGIQTDEFSSIIINNCNVNGNHIEHVEIKYGDIYGELSDSIKPLVFRHNLGFYTFPGKEYDVIGFMRLCHQEIEQFYEKFYNIL